MLFALDTDDGRLLVLSTPDEAAAHCKPVDVQDGFWLFFADDGSPLEPRFERTPAQAAAEIPRAFFLQRAMSGRWLQERLESVASVSGCGLETVADVAETLKINRGRKIQKGR